MKRMTKAERAKADAAYLASMQDELPLGVSAAAVPVGYLVRDAVPTECPTCGKSMTFESGWALVFGDLLQCGGCAQLVQVPREAYERFGRKLHEYFARKVEAINPKTLARDRRSRGAR